MLKENSKIKIHIYDTNKKEIKTRGYNDVFTVIKSGGVLGVIWGYSQEFVPFCSFSHTVIFENIENNKQYYFNSIYNKLMEV